MKAQSHHGLFRHTEAKSYVIAHRGDCRAHVENTLGAILAAEQKGADMVECDLQLTADKQVVLFHDHDLKRLAQHDQKISDYDYQALSQIQLQPPHPQAAAATIPLLKDVLDQSGSQLHFYLEIKSEHLSQTEVMELVRATKQVLDHHPKKTQCFAASFDHRSLTAARDAGLERLTLIAEDQISKEDYQRWDILSLSYALFESYSSDQLNDIQRPLIVWDVRSAEQVQTLRSLEVAGICLDDLSLAL